MTAPGASRHPAARAGGADLVHIAGFIARRGGFAGDGPHPAVALAAQAVRGRQRRSVAAFARAYGLEEADVARLEGGWVAASGVPAVLQVLTPLDQVRRALELVLGPPSPTTPSLCPSVPLCPSVSPPPEPGA